TTSASSTTPLLSSLSSRSTSVVSLTSRTASAGLGLTVFGDLVCRRAATSRALDEGVGWPRAGEVDGVAFRRQPAGFARHGGSKPAFAGPRHEERRVE